jgi:hypothetical protein
MLSIRSLERCCVKQGLSSLALFAWQNPNKLGKKVLKDLKKEASSVSCVYGIVHRADECLFLVLPGNLLLQVSYIV